MYNGVYQNRRVLVTGNTGFKGSWLSLWLKHLGADVFGASLPEDNSESHWSSLNLQMETCQVDITDNKAITQIIEKIKPEIIFHLAAQSIVSEGYDDPVRTWETNVIGTLNVLQAAGSTEAVQAIVAVTTDKVYRNQEWEWGYRESDPLGGIDPYSSSKAAMELLIASHRESFLKGKGKLVASVRAGNVIGGGDWTQNRLVPDYFRASVSNECLEIRNPLATRPWQHVLDSLSGYLLLGQHLISGNTVAAQAWNFGPGQESNLSVSDVLIRLDRIRNKTTELSEVPGFGHEANNLYLDSGKARGFLDWMPVWSLDQTLQMTAEWYDELIANELVVSERQLIKYITEAQKRNLVWAK